MTSRDKPWIWREKLRACYSRRIEERVENQCGRNGPQMHREGLVITHKKKEMKLERERKSEDVLGWGRSVVVIDQ